jgi:hypothetical protein
MTALAKIEGILRQEFLFVSGHVTDDLPSGVQTLLLLSPKEPDFWGHFTASPEFHDGSPDPLNRWTTAAVARLTPQIEGSASLFPFGGPPWQPFIDWAKRSGSAHPSPVGLLVHEKAGLFISYRAALALPYAIDMTDHPNASPCEACTAPCLTACPVNAFANGEYNVPACKAYLDAPAGQNCRMGCKVRRAGPVGHGLRLPAQSAFHMEAFHPNAT